MKKVWRLMLVMSIGAVMTLNAIDIDSQGICRIEGKEFPAVGYGTYPLTGNTCVMGVSQAAACGYRILDTATFYANLEPIGEALQKLGRQQFYVISKVWPDAHTAARVKADLQTTLNKLQTNYLDAYLIHWPNSKVPIEETLGAMEELRQQKLIRHIGLSNVTINHLKRIFELDIPISWVQVEMHPQYYDPELVAFCQQHGIAVQAWAPLGRGRLSQDVDLAKIGKNHGKTAAQVAIRWIIQHGCLPLPASKNPDHMRQNFDVFDFELTPQEMQAIDNRAKTGERERVSLDWGLGFADEFDYTYEQCWPK